MLSPKKNRAGKSTESDWEDKLSTYMVKGRHLTDEMEPAMCRSWGRVVQAGEICKYKGPEVVMSISSPPKTHRIKSIAFNVSKEFFFCGLFTKPFPFSLMTFLYYTENWTFYFDNIYLLQGEFRFIINLHLKISWEVS